MVKVKVLYQDNLVKNLVVTGHSGYEVVGKDIVCAALSSICITTVNGILRIDKDALIYDEKEGFLKIEVLKHDLVIDSLLTNMIDLVSELRSNYPKNIVINKEVL